MDEERYHVRRGARDWGEERVKRPRGREERGTRRGDKSTRVFVYSETSTRGQLLHTDFTRNCRLIPLLTSESSESS